jgi:Spy/CpxP family protein refolding chaperone
MGAGHAEGGWRSGWGYSLSPDDDPAAMGFGSGAFGVRRPLRFLAYKLGLHEAQVAELAKILDDLKTERAQAAVDHRRTLSAFADAVSGDAFDGGKAESGARLRLESADRLRGAVLSALERLHAILDPEQRARLAYLIRTGTLTL